jgi:capsid protein
MALELPKEVLVKKFEASFSAARASINDAFCTFLMRRGLLTHQLCNPVYGAWMTEDVARGYSYAPGFNSDPMIRHAYLGSDWIGAAMRQINPVYEVDAAMKRVDLKLTTRSEECQALTGTDWESKLPQIERESKMFAPAPTPAQGAPAQPAPNPNNPQDENGDAETE